MDTNVLTGIIVDAAVEIDSGVRPGCFEKVYEEILYFELGRRGLEVDRQVTMPIHMTCYIFRTRISLICWLQKN